MSPDHVPYEGLGISYNNRSFTVPYGRQRELLMAHSHGEAAWRVQKIQAEFIKGYDFLDKFDKAVSIFGSARSGFDDVVYREAEQLAGILAGMGFAVFTGGGPGVMEAANKGAHDAGGVSVGININLPKQDRRFMERRNPYVDEAESFDFFFSRKVILSFASQFYIFFPGGYGTLDELFEMLTLVQTKKTSPIPIILIGKEFWSPLVQWLTDVVWQQNKAINREDLDIFHVVDDAEGAVAFITTCLVRTGGKIPTARDNEH